MVEIMLKSLIFDFDGLILDTETPELEAWQAIYRDHGYELSIQAWGQTVGGNGVSSFDPAKNLVSLTDKVVDEAALREHVLNSSLAIIHRKRPLPGMEALIHEARRRGMKLAIASSSPHEWVEGHLDRLDMRHLFDVIICSEDVVQIKPHPDLFLAALKALNVRPDEAVVFEDSPNGVLAARTAGIFVVAVPNPVTRQLNLEGANKIVDSLEMLSLDDIVVLVG
jgi:HAD superfamily hydrolase (TIGR01509 family)